MKIKTWIKNNKPTIKDITTDVVIAIGTILIFWGLLDWWVVLGANITFHFMWNKVKRHISSKNEQLNTLDVEFQSYRDFTEEEFGKCQNVIEEKDSVIKE